MKAADSLRFVMPIGVAVWWFPPCLRARRADVFAPHVARHSARGATPPVRLRPERHRRSKAQGKIKGHGTPWREKSVCTWGWCSTRQAMATCRTRTQCRIGIGEIACFACRSAKLLDGSAP